MSQIDASAGQIYTQLHGIEPIKAKSVDLDNASLQSLARDRFANLSYSAIKGSGPAFPPLGFPAPQVVRAKITSALCYDKGKQSWSQENILLQRDEGEVGEECHSNVGFLLTSYKLKQTLCGEILRCVVVSRVNKIEADAIDASLPVEIDQFQGHSQEMESRHSKPCGKHLWQKTNKYVAVKVDRRSKMKQLHNEKSIQRNPENPWKEVAAMQLLSTNNYNQLHSNINYVQHPNVMPLIGAYMDDESLYEVMPYYSGGNLSSYMRTRPHGLPEEQARYFFNQILNGLHYMHSRGVCHHDLSTDNIMLETDGDDGGLVRCVIIDFGMCLRVPHSYIDDPTGTTDDVTDVSMGTDRRLIRSHNHCGKLRFMAPEIYRKEEEFDGLAADIWSLGVILFVMLTGRQPYEAPHCGDSGFYDLMDEEYYWNIGRVDPMLSWGRDISPEAVDVLRRMLRVDPRERATLGWVLSCAFVKDAVDIELSKEQ